MYSKDSFYKFYYKKEYSTFLKLCTFSRIKIHKEKVKCATIYFYIPIKLLMQNLNNTKNIKREGKK